MDEKMMQRLLAAASGREEADVVLKNAQVFNVFTGEFEAGDVALCGAYIAGIGKYKGKQEMDLTGRYVTPGFIDGHMHLESSMVTPGEFARAVVPQGTTAVVADPHEIANVSGLAGIEYLLEASEGLPCSVYVMLPSCVPATHLETAGARLEAEGLAKLAKHPRVLGLGEVMNYPAVVHGEAAMLCKLRLFEGRPVDGHAPGLSGLALNAYAAAGIHSDHECATAEEGKARLARGLHLMLREGSAAHNLLDLLPAVTAQTLPRCLFVTDDRHPADLLQQGHVNHLVRLAVEAGLKPAWALQMATWNVAQYFRLPRLGAVAPGYQADLLVFEDLVSWRPAQVWKQGQLAAEKGKPLFAVKKTDAAAVRQTVRLASLESANLQVPAHGEKARIIDLMPGQIVTGGCELALPVKEGCFTADAAQEVVRLTVWERHQGSGRIGSGFLRGLGLRKGALASTVAHDSHNLIVAGVSEADMLAAVREVQRLGGGLAAVADGEVLASLALPLGGLLSEQPLEEVQRQLGALHAAARSLGVKKEHDPFMTLAFLSLPVIPRWKITDLGLVDVDLFQIVPVSLAAAE